MKESKTTSQLRMTICSPSKGQSYVIRSKDSKVLFFIFLIGFCIFASALLAPEAAAQDGQPTLTLLSADEIIASMPQEKVAIAKGFTEAGYWNFLFDLVWYGLIALLLMKFKVPQNLFSFFQRRFKKPWLQKSLFMSAILLVIYSITWPLNFYDDYVRESLFGFSNQTSGEWFIEHFVSVIFTALIFTPFLLLVYWFLNRFKKHQWVWASVSLTAFFVFILIITPVLIDPLTNDYSPIEDPVLKADLLELARGNGLGIDEIYTYDTSTQSTAMNAKVTGIFGTGRISINDNMLNGAQPGEIKVVVAHELGHLVLGHNGLLVAIFVPLIFFGIWLLFLLFEKIHTRLGKNWGITNIADMRGLPLVVFLYFLVSALVLPAIYGAQRYIEVEADKFAMETLRDPENFVSVLVNTAGRRKFDPSLLEKILFHDHPSLKDRLEFALEWNAREGKKIE